MKRVLITGANSYVGTSFENYIKTNFSGDYAVDTVDMQGDGWKSKSFAGYDSVFHVAGIAHSDGGKISPEKEKLYYSVNTQLAIDCAKKAKEDGVPQFIFMSSAIVYGDSAPIGKEKLITSDTAPSPANCYGDSKLKAEEGIRSLEDGTFRAVIIRSPMVYGKGSKGNYPSLSKFARKLPLFPNVKNQRSMLYIENLCEFVRLMVKDEASGTFWPQNSDYSNTSQLVKLIAATHGKKLRLVKGFGWVLKLMGCFVGMVNKAFGNLSYSMEISEYKENYRVCDLAESLRRTEGKV